MTAKTAQFIVECVVDKTFKDHYGKCKPYLAEGIVCTHIGSGNLDVARAVEAGIKVGKKRATLDLACPYSTSDPQEQIHLLELIAVRLAGFSKAKASMQVDAACSRIVGEILNYAHRNAMEVIAEAAL